MGRVRVEDIDPIASIVNSGMPINTARITMSTRTSKIPRDIPRSPGTSMDFASQLTHLRSIPLSAAPTPTNTVLSMH